MSAPVSEFNESLMRAVKSACKQGKVVVKGDFLYERDKAVKPRDWSSMRPLKIDNIARDEVIAAMQEVIHR